MINYFAHLKENCDAFIAKIDIMMGYPNPDTKTFTYSIPIQHKKINSKHMVILKPVWSPKLNRMTTINDIDNISDVSEKENRLSHEDLEEEGAFGDSITF